MRNDPPADARVTPVTDPDDQQRELLAATMARDGAPLNIFATLAHHPTLLKRFNVLGGMFLTRGKLPARERELVILRVAWRSGSVYEFGQHTEIGRRCGLTEGEIWQVTQEELPGPWLDADADLLAFTDELVATSDVVDPTWAAVEQRLDTAQTLELVCLVGFYRMVAGLLNSVRVAPETTLPGWPANPEP